MDNVFLNFIKDAYSNGLCEEYRQEIAACHGNKTKLINLAMRQQSIPWIADAGRRGVLTKEYLLKAFDGLVNTSLLQDCDNVTGYTYRMFVGCDDDFINIDCDVVHFMWAQEAYVVIPFTKCPSLYVSNGSNVNISLDGFNSLRVYLFDNSTVNFTSCDETCKVTVYKYSKDCKVFKGDYCLNDNIVEHEKTLRL